MTLEEALTAGILALNSLQDMQATSDADYQWLDEHTEEALTVLVQAREKVQRS